MKHWKKILVMKGDDPLEVVEEDEYHISNGCWYFHDQEEFDEFSNVDDDTPKS